MFPFFPSLPNHLQMPGCNGSAPQQMVLQNVQQQVCNPCSQPNPVCFSNMQQIQPQLGAPSHQFQIPQVAAFNNQNMDKMHGNSVVMPNGPQLAPSPLLACNPEVSLAVRASLGGMQPQHGQPCLNQNPQNMNQPAALMFHGQICNVSQSLNQLGVPQLGGQLGINSQVHNVNQVCSFSQREQLWLHNLSQNLNQVMGLQGQLCSQNPMLQLHQIPQLPQHAVGIAPAGPFNVPQSSFPARPGPGPQITFSSNFHSGPKNVDSAFVNSLLSTDPTKNTAQSQGISMQMAVVSQNASQTSLAGIMHKPPFAAVSTKTNKTQKSLPSHSVQVAQADRPRNTANDISGAISRNYARRDFKRNPHGIVKGDQSHRRFQKPNHQLANGGSFSKNWGKGSQNVRERNPRFQKYGNEEPEKHQRRSISIKYTEEEIKQWREARKRNFPTAANIERKRHESKGNPKALNEDAIIRCQQLKDVLSKQMELGFEAAEVPSHYLSGPVNKPCERYCTKESYMPARFPDKFGKRGRHGSETWQSKRQKRSDGASPVPVAMKRGPTLLQKLLSSEIKRDRSRLLQALRFMTLNSFFEQWPEKPLEYPSVTVRELGREVERAEGKSLHGEHITSSGFRENSRAKEVDDQGEPGAGDQAEASTDESACVSNGDRPDEEGADKFQQVSGQRDFVTEENEADGEIIG